MKMTRFLLSLLVFCTLVLSLNARNRDRIVASILEDENEIDLDRLQMFRRLFERLSEGFNTVSHLPLEEGGTYSDLKGAHKWMENYEKQLQKMAQEEADANWNYATNITDFTAQQRDNVTLKWLPWAQNASIEAAKFYHFKKYFESEDHKNKDLVRKLKMVARCGSRASSDDVRLTQDLTRLETIYSSASVTDSEGQTYKLDPGLTELLKTSRDYEKLKWAWQSWRDASGKRMKSLFTDSVKLQNESAVAAGLDDLGDQWRACNYEEPEKKTDDNEEEPEEKKDESTKNPFVKDIVDDLLVQIEPLYKELHAYVRYKLRQLYPEQTNTEWFRDDLSPIPAHLLGNMWAQHWRIVDLVKPFPEAQDVDVTNEMKEQGYTVHRMFRTAESFFTSLGLYKMTDVFWEKSLTVRPTDDREVVCHASAEDFSRKDDFRIKMCATVTQQDLQTIHHEMGHIEYFMAYSNQPQPYRQGANAAFHEAIGDTIALSVMTPNHLKTLGLLPDEESSSNVDKWNDYPKRDINFLMKMALTKIAFLPFGYLIDKWRWDVFSGKVTEENYNRKWWEYRIKYQGIAPPVERSEEDFDPGAKYHVAANVPYIRYFMSFIGQFQFQKGLCDAKQHSGDLYNCDIFGSKETSGKHLKNTLKLGSSVHWPEAMKKMTGGTKFDATAIRAYFRPLIKWLEEYRKNGGNHRYRRGWTNEQEVLSQCFET